jgi:hypothetical protein
MPDRKPWREVLLDPPPRMRSGRGGLLGPDTFRRTHWWELRLSCGHRVERTVRYRPQDRRYVARGAASSGAPPTRSRLPAGCDATTAMP